ncbi:MAG: hypothetical protein LUF02_07585 [Erysipelotrichaceae bacterium]|nr:hypothetical protein [Erysipelotrichaceae bacterium]
MGEKMIAVLQIFMLSDHKYLSSKEIIEQLKDFHIYVERKHIYTIFDQINSFFYPVFYDNIIKSLKKRGSYLDVDYFHDGELQFLLDNITYHEDLNDEDKRQLKIN